MTDRPDLPDDDANQDPRVTRRPPGPGASRAVQINDPRNDIWGTQIRFGARERDMTDKAWKALREDVLKTVRRRLDYARQAAQLRAKAKM